MKKSPLKRHSKLRIKGISDISTTKDEIQDIVREIVILRDGGCILRNYPLANAGKCGGFRKDGQLILQADHLITRGNSATYADTRLIVCLCKSHHGGFKKWNKEKYDYLVKEIIGKERRELWEKCDRERFVPHRTTAYDWKMALVILKQELKKLENEE